MAADHVVHRSDFVLIAALSAFLNLLPGQIHFGPASLFSSYCVTRSYHLKLPDRQPPKITPRREADAFLPLTPAACRCFTLRR